MHHILQKFDIHWYGGGPSIVMVNHLRRVSDLLYDLLCYMKNVVLHCSIFLFKWNKIVWVRVQVREHYISCPEKWSDHFVVQNSSWVMKMVHSSVTWICMARAGILMLVKCPRHVDGRENWLLATEYYVSEQGLYVTRELRRFASTHWGWNKMATNWQTTQLQMHFMNKSIRILLAVIRSWISPNNEIWWRRENVRETVQQSTGPSQTSMAKRGVGSFRRFIHVV